MRLGSALRAAVMIALVPAASGAQVVDGPRMEIREPQRNLGVVRQGEAVSLAFEVVNSGGQTLTLDVRATCDCTVVSFDHEIAPGSSGTIAAELDTASLAGPVSKTIQVLSNDPVEPVASLVVDADIRVVLAVLPRPLLRLGGAYDSSRSAAVFVVPTADLGEYAVTGIDTGEPFLEAEARRLSPDELEAGYASPQYRIVVKLSEDAPLGYFSTSLLIHTDLAGGAAVGVKVVGTVTPRH